MLLAIDFTNLHEILQVLYQDMMPLCEKLTGVAKGIAGLGALFYVAAKVWQALARAEPIDVYPLLRPFAIGLCILFFPTFVIGTINTVLSPVVKGCHELFFTLSPDKSAIEGNIKRSLLLADKSAFNYYKDLSEKGYYNRIISGNINQMIEIDSLRCDFDKYPYSVRTFARQIILRESSVTERSLVTRCRLLDAVRSDNNPQGFIIEGFEITENKDLQTLKR